MTVIFLIAFLMVVHLLIVHAHDDPSALEACLVVAGSAVLALLAGVVQSSERTSEGVVTTGRLTVHTQLVGWPPPCRVGTVMRH